MIDDPTEVFAENPLFQNCTWKRCERNPKYPMFQNCIWTCPGIRFPNFVDWTCCLSLLDYCHGFWGYSKERIFVSTDLDSRFFVPSVLDSCFVVFLPDSCFVFVPDYSCCRCFLGACCGPFLDWHSVLVVVWGWAVDDCFDWYSRTDRDRYYWTVVVVMVWTFAFRSFDDRQVVVRPHFFVPRSPPQDAIEVLWIHGVARTSVPWSFSVRVLRHSRTCERPSTLVGRFPCCHSRKDETLETIQWNPVGPLFEEDSFSILVVVWWWWWVLPRRTQAGLRRVGCDCWIAWTPRFARGCAWEKCRGIVPD
jgi:hypothetical protein